MVGSGVGMGVVGCFDGYGLDLFVDGDVLTSGLIARVGLCVVGLFEDGVIVVGWVGVNIVG